jgi:hypothetical protein
MIVDERVADILQGYARAAEFQKKERMERLARLSTEESWTIYTDLVESWYHSPANDDTINRLLSWRLETMIAVRQTFKKLAQSKGLI